MFTKSGLPFTKQTQRDPVQKRNNLPISPSNEDKESMSTLAYFIGYAVLALIAVSILAPLIFSAVGALARHGGFMVSIFFLGALVWLDAHFLHWAGSLWVVIAICVFQAFSLLKRKFFPDKTIQERRREAGYDG